MRTYRDPLPAGQAADEWVPPPSPPVEPEPYRSRAVLAVILITVAAAAFGLPLALVWEAVAVDQPTEPEQFFAVVGWFAVLGSAHGVLAGAGAWLCARRARGPVGLVAVTVGALAGGLLAWWLGGRLGIPDYRRQAGVTGPSAWWPLRDAGTPLVPALAAAVTYTVLAAWSRFPSLRPEPYGPPEGPPDGRSQ